MTTTFDVHNPATGELVGSGISYLTEQQSIASSIAAGGGYDSLVRLMTSPARARTLLRIITLWRRIPGLR